MSEHLWVFIKGKREAFLYGLVYSFHHQDFPAEVEASLPNKEKKISFELIGYERCTGTYTTAGRSDVLGHRRDSSSVVKPVEEGASLK